VLDQQAPPAVRSTVVVMTNKRHVWEWKDLELVNLSSFPSITSDLSKETKSSVDKSFLILDTIRAYWEDLVDHGAQQVLELSVQ